jgi:Tol biopolymer transport system component
VVALAGGFTVQQAAARDAWVVGSHRRLAETETNDGQPTVDAEGRLVAFTGRAPAGRKADIYVLELSTGTVRQITFDGGNQTPAFCPLAARHPRGRILYAGHWRRGPKETILAIDTLGGGRELVGPQVGVDNTEGAPNHLPDGRVVYDTQDPQWGIWYMSEDGSGASKLSGISSRAQEPRVSPDGRWIAYHTQSPTGECYDIYVCNVPAPGESEATERRLTSESACQGGPSFSPDSRWIAYHSREDGGRFFDIWVLCLDDPSVRQQVTFENVDQMEPAWLPDGSGIVYRGTEGGESVSNLWLVEVTDEARDGSRSGMTLADRDGAEQ